MRLFGYYAWHSFKNQIKKLFKTWLIVFILVCALVGGLIGFGAASLSDLSEAQQGETAGEEIETEETDEIDESDAFFEDSVGALMEFETNDIVELIAGAIILLIIIFDALAADKNGSKIFLPADASLLFSSPMKPQSVLLFRLGMQLGTTLFASFYILAQLPNLVVNAGLSVMTAVVILVTWVLSLAFTKAFQVFLYILASRYELVKKNLNRVIYGILILIAGAFLLYVRTSGLDMLTGAFGFFNAPASRFVPFWGWMKGMVGAAMVSDHVSVIVYFLLTLIGVVLLVFFTWRMKADFYEEAMKATEETAELLERANSEKGTALVKRKKDRSDRFMRDGMRHGNGANVFFFKSMYNRFRFAHFHVFTKTAETYLAVAVGGIVLFNIRGEGDGLVVTLLAFSVIAFFRALGNPLAEDTKMDYFVLIPENTWAKLFYSMAGGLLNSLLDMLPAVIILTIAFPFRPFTALLLMLLAVTMDYYCTAVGTFLDISLTESIAKMAKTLVQVFFIYFGLLPDIAIIAIGLVMNAINIAVPLAMLCNIILGSIFFALTPLFIDPMISGRK